MNDTRITIAGNCADAPELRFTKEGKATARVRVAVLERYQNSSGQWLDGATSWFTVIAWGALAENLAATVGKGDRVLVNGRFAQRDYLDEKNERRSVWELTADEIGPSLRHVTADLTRPQRVPAQK